MLNTQLFSKALKFASHAAIKRDIRYYLLGVRLEIAGQTLTLIATDGARLALCSLTMDCSMPDGAMTIGNDDVKRVLSTIAKDKGSISLRVEPSTDANAPSTLVIEAAGTTSRIKGLDGVYPNVRRVIPSAGRTAGVMPNLQPRLLAEACAALEPLTGNIKGVKSVRFDVGPQTSDIVVLRPVTIDEPAVKELLVVISPTYQ